MNLIATLIGWGVPAKLAKPLLYAIGVLLLLVAVFAVVKLHDRRVISTHNATQNAVNAQADRKADQNAATSRVADQTRSDAENTAIKEAVNEAGPDPAARRAAYYHCVELQQAARRSGKQPASC